MTSEEEKRIVDKVTENLYKSLPEIVANIVRSVQTHSQRFMEFYKKYPEFREYPEIVGETIQMVEGRDPLRPYDEVIELAVPEIRKAIQERKKVDMLPVPEVNLGVIDESTQ